MTIRTLLVAGLLLGLASEARAQQPLSVGSATALSEAAVTEARRTDAAWNPAVVAVYDGPVSSYSLLATDIRALPAPAWGRQARILGLDGGAASLRWTGRLAPGGGAAVGEGGVQWFATQRRAFSIALSSHYLAAAAVPRTISDAIGAKGGAPSPTPTDSSVRALSTLVSATAGTHVGRLPLLGSLWVGATGKAWWLHSYARGSFETPASDEAYREVVLRNVPGYGIDLGLLAQPVQRVRVGASVTNVLAGALLPKRGPQVRTVALTEGEDGQVHVDEAFGPYLGSEDEDTEDGRRAAALWNSVAFPAVLRAGAAVETDRGTFAAAYRTTLKEGGLDPEWYAAPYAAAYSGTAAFPLRLAYGFGGRTRSITLGMHAGSCERRWSAALVRRSTPWGTGYGVQASGTIGSAAGCDVFRS